MSYSESVIESYLPSVWDRTYAWGLSNEHAPDPDMPTVVYKDPRAATNFWTHLIDIRMAWDRAPLTMPERRALLLFHGFGWTEEEIGKHQSVSQQAISKRLSKGVTTLTDWLNADFELPEDTMIGTK